MHNHYLWVKTPVNDYYKFTQKLAYLKLPILAIKYEKDEVYLKIKEADYPKLQKYLVSYKFRKVKDIGIYQLKNIFIKYRELIICFFIGLILLIIGSNLIVDVKVIHENKEIRELVLTELEEAGIKKLTFKKSYRYLQKVKEEILDKYPDKIDWLEFEVKGMVYNVRIEERIITDLSKDTKKCHIVASKAGTISNMRLVKGEALVRPNDYVREGDILISGIITYNEAEKMRVCAAGEVYAHTWYTVSVKVPFTHNIDVATGNKKYNLVWDNGKNQNRILQKRFAYFTSNYKTLLKLFDYRLLLETEKEMVRKQETFDEEQALQEGLKKAEESLKVKLHSKDTIIDKKVLKKSVNNSTMNIELFIVVNELISTEQEIEEMNIEGTDNSDMGNNQGDNQ